MERETKIDLTVATALVAAAKIVGQKIGEDPLSVIGRPYGVKPESFKGKKRTVWVTFERYCYPSYSFHGEWPLQTERITVMVEVLVEEQRSLNIAPSCRVLTCQIQ